MLPGGTTWPEHSRVGTGMQIPSIETGRLLLRPWRPEDAEAWCGILQEKDILRFFPNPSPPARSKAEQYIEHHNAHWARHSYGHWAVVTPPDSRIIGWCGLEYLPDLDDVEVAYLLSHRAWGQGYATEAAKAAVKFGFETAGLPKIIGLVHPENSASIRVLEKCGLTYADRVRLWGMEILRYRISRTAYESGAGTGQMHWATSSD